MCKHSKQHNLNYYFEAPSLSKVSLFKRTLTSVTDLGDINSTTKSAMHCLTVKYFIELSRRCVLYEPRGNTYLRGV